MVQTEPRGLLEKELRQEVLLGEAMSILRAQDEEIET